MLILYNHKPAAELSSVTRFQIDPLVSLRGFTTVLFHIRKRVDVDVIRESRARDRDSTLASLLVDTAFTMSSKSELLPEIDSS